MKKVGICFSKELQGNKPLNHIVVKLPVYLRLLDLIEKNGWQAFILTRRTYKGGGIFGGGWKYSGGKFYLTNENISVDLVYDRTGGIDFPLPNDDFSVVNPRNFKILCWDKWSAYKEIGEYMPKTLLIENEAKIKQALHKISSEKVVLKPFNGLKGLGIFIGGKSEALNFKFPEKYSKYIMQEFVDTSGGVSEITTGMHDMRIVIINGEAVWCHVRVPKKGSLTANAARGGKLTELDYRNVPKSIIKIVEKVSSKFINKYGNTVYSIDFGMDINGTPKIFEINDMIGFPTWEMKNRDKFLLGLIENFRQRLQ